MRANYKGSQSLASMNMFDHNDQMVRSHQCITLASHYEVRRQMNDRKRLDVVVAVRWGNILAAFSGFISLVCWSSSTYLHHKKSIYRAPLTPSRITCNHWGKHLFYDVEGEDPQATSSLHSNYRPCRLFGHISFMKDTIPSTARWGRSYSHFRFASRATALSSDV